MKNINPFNTDLTAEQLKKVKTLVRRDCCNYNGGNCILLDDGDEHPCPQLNSLHLICNWFKDAVLPLNAALVAEICAPDKDSTKKCTTCGKSFLSQSNSAKYCPKCAVKVRKNKQAEYARKKRSNVDK